MNRIVYVGGFELPDKNAAAHRVLTIAKVLREENIEVVFISVSKTEIRPVLETKTRIYGFDTYMIPYPDSKNQWISYLTDISKVITVMGRYERVDGVICYNYQAIAFDKLRRYCRKKKIKIYADCTEWYNTDGTSFVFKLLKGFDTWFRMRIIHKRLDGIIVISKYLREYYNGCKNVTIIPPLVDIKDEKWHESAEKLGNYTNFIYAGLPGKKDKINEIIEAFIALPTQYKYDFWIIGINEKQFRESYPLFGEISKNIHFLGRLSHEKSISYIKGADCSLIIRDSNRTNNAGFPTKFSEAITAGIDVIASDISDLKDYQDKVEKLYIVHDDLKKVIMQYLDEYKGRNRCISNVFDYRKWKEKVIVLLQ